jgi:hypothetical protein
VAKVHRARDLMKMIAKTAWQCGDPGMQFDTTINKWHTCKATAPIHASNPCSEYMFLDDSACNLASLNLMKFLTSDGKFEVESFKHAVDIMITAQEILVDNASYPTERIAKNSHDFRPLGLGYANLRAADGQWFALRFRRRARLLGRHHGLDARRGLPPVVPYRRRTRAFFRLSGQSRRISGCHFHAPAVAPAH